MLAKPTTVDEYLNQQPAKIRPILKQLRQTIRNAAPEAEEVISYSMPAYKYHGILVYFMAHQNHFGFYPGANALVVFKDKITQYETSKGTVRFPYDKPLPATLVTAIVKFCVKENLEKQVLREMARRSKKRKNEGLATDYTN